MILIVFSITCPFYPNGNSFPISSRIKIDFILEFFCSLSKALSRHPFKHLSNSSEVLGQKQPSRGVVEKSGFLDKEIKVDDVFKPGQLIDAHSVTTGKGYQGPVKRFGIRLKHHKSEKGQRRPGVLSAWGRPLQLMFRAAYASKTGYNMRTDYNKYLFKISNDELSPIDNYGIVKNTYILIKGSVPGPKNRLITLTNAVRPNKRLQMATPEFK